MSTREPTSSTFLTGMAQASRPTGPVLGLVVVGLVLLVGQVIGLFVVMFALDVSVDGLLGGAMGLPEQLAMTLNFAGCVALLAAWLRWKERRPFVSLGFPARRVGSSLALGAVVALALLALPVSVNLILGQYQLTGATFTAVGFGGVLLALVGFVVQGSTEEILVRGYLMQTTYRKWGLRAAIVLQAVVFTVLHGANTGINAVSIVNLLLISLLLVFWALAEGGLWGVCAFHAVWNWSQGNLYGIEVSGLDIRTTMLEIDNAAGGSALVTGAEFGAEGSLVTTAVLVGATWIAYRVYRTR